MGWPYLNLWVDNVGRICDGINWSETSEVSMDEILENDFSKPATDITDIDAVFGASKIDTLLPKMKDIPEDFRGEIGEAKKWTDLTIQWFYGGGRIGIKEAKEGIDAGKAIYHIKSVLASFEPSHERKIAGAAYLLSKWFNNFTIEKEQ